jgi:hypothetical protein
MGAGKADLRIEQGATLLYTIDVVGLDLAGVSGDMQVRSRPGAVHVLLELSTANGGMVIMPTGAATATILLTATAEQMAGVAGGVGSYDLELTFAASLEVVRLLYGKIMFSPEVTR